MTYFDIEVEHAISSIDLDYGEECHVKIANGLILATPAYPEDCSYVRILTPKGYELAYWIYDEWEADGKSVMGAIIGSLCQCSEMVQDLEQQIESILKLSEWGLKVKEKELI